MRPEEEPPGPITPADERDDAQQAHEHRNAHAFNHFIELGIRQVRRLVVLVVGATVVLLGVVMLVTPGPGLVVIPVGLGILAIEFVWARRLLQRFRDEGVQIKDTIWAKVIGAKKNGG